MDDLLARPTPTEPTELGDFLLFEVLGQGGSGTVYAAAWNRAEEAQRAIVPEFALKVLREDATPSEKETRRFVEEAARIRRVEHPGLIKVLDAGTLIDGRPYLVMPLLLGETLGARMATGPLALDAALAVFEQLAEGVAALHEAGIIHRDIKPENVFLQDRPNGPPTAILLDFGIARDAYSTTSTTTQAGVIRGTPAYMAPERFFGTPAAISSDVYELAVVLYVMLVGKLPWDGPESASARLQPRHPAEAGARMPARLATVLLQAMSTRPEARPSTARALAAKVRAAAANLSDAGDDGAGRHTAEVFAEDAPRDPTTKTSAVLERPSGVGVRGRVIGAALALALVGIAVMGMRLSAGSAPPESVAAKQLPAVAIPIAIPIATPAVPAAITTSSAMAPAATVANVVASVPAPAASGRAPAASGRAPVATVTAASLGGRPRLETPDAGGEDRLYQDRK